MAQVLNYKANSIILLENDRIKGVYLVKQGYVELRKIDEDDNEVTVDILKPGDFIQLLEVLNGFPSFYNVYAKTDVVLVSFALSEFENLLLQNPNISIKIIKSFSEILREINEKIKALIAEETMTSNDENLFNIGEFYYKNGKYKQAMYVYSKYVYYYPHGKFIEQAQQRINYIKENFSDEAMMFEGSDVEHRYYQAVNEYANENYQGAIGILSQLLDEISENDRLYSKVLYDLGRSYNRIQEFDNAILFLEKLTSEKPDFEDIGRAYKELGNAYYDMGKKEEAVRFYSEALKYEITDKEKIRERIKEIRGEQ